MRFAAALTIVAGMLAASQPTAAQITNAPAQKTKQAVKVETFASGLVHPWGLAFLPDGRLLVTERPGRMRVVAKDGKLSPTLQGVPPVLAAGQGGLLDVALSPDFASSRLIYFSYSEPRSAGLNGTSVARAPAITRPRSAPANSPSSRTCALSWSSTRPRPTSARLRDDRAAR
jgi:glucose/arabinose dehydrogenase